MTLPHNKSLLPPNATRLERAQEQPILIAGDEIVLRDLWDADKCPAHLLEWLAYVLSVDHWDKAWPEHLKRKTIGASIQIHQHKGTRWALIQVLASLEITAKVIAWHEQEPHGEPYSFVVEIDAVNQYLAGLGPLGPEVMKTLHYLVEVTKSLRDVWSVQIRTEISACLGQALGGGCLNASHQTWSYGSRAKFDLGLSLAGGTQTTAFLKTQHIPKTQLRPGLSMAGVALTFMR